MQRAPEIVIIGAGPGGLAAAMLLSAAGLRVTVLERQDTVGGRTSTVEVDGFRFDRGPTFFMQPDILREVFEMCGRSLEDEIARIAPEDAVNFDRFMDDNRRKLEAFGPVFRSNFADPRVRLAFTFQTKYLGMSSWDCPSLFTILSFLEYEFGLCHPRGGCGAVSTAMANVARELGAEIRLGEPVQSLEFDGRWPTAALTAAGRYRCDALIINADSARAMKRLVPDTLRRRWTDRKIARKRFSCSTFMLYLGLEGREELDHHTIYLSSDYRQNLEDIANHYRLSEEPSIYVANPCTVDPSMAPPGCSALYVLVPVPHRHPNIDWQSEAAVLRNMVLQRLEELGVRNVENRIRCERMLTPEGWDRDFEIHLGATFNLAHILGQLLHLRPRNRFEDLESVYLVGGGTHPGSGLPVIYESAKISSRLLTEDLGVEPGWQARSAAQASA